MTRAEEKMLLRAILEIGRKVAALDVPGRSLHMPAVYDQTDNIELLQAMGPLRSVVDEWSREEAARKRKPRKKKERPHGA